MDRIISSNMPLSNCAFSTQSVIRYATCHHDGYNLDSITGRGGYRATWQFFPGFPPRGTGCRFPRRTGWRGVSPVQRQCASGDGPMRSAVVSTWRPGRREPPLGRWPHRTFCFYSIPILLLIGSMGVLAEIRHFLQGVHMEHRTNGNGSETVAQRRNHRPARIREPPLRHMIPFPECSLSLSLSSFSPPCPCNTVDVGSVCTRILGCVKRPVSTLRGTGVAGPRAEFVSSLAGGVPCHPASWSRIIPAPFDALRVQQGAVSRKLRERYERMGLQDFPMKIERAALIRDIPFCLFPGRMTLARHGPAV